MQFTIRAIVLLSVLAHTSLAGDYAFYICDTPLCQIQNLTVVKDKEDPACHTVTTKHPTDVVFDFSDHRGTEASSHIQAACLGGFRDENCGTKGGEVRYEFNSISVGETLKYPRELNGIKSVRVSKGPCSQDP
ncbi:hypothetical protein BDU57DRAFT_309685 [Ampelomyces quisqualis]|uniref:Uncharacterized protein n=1 Tax=Ampelomyces quisqualis TaxID=50730 RepID=A0A6A5QJH0_AMPQU|nr:hypothetical protein BDU57DRAFT_309685 [Ampelomyces quisqualis]